MPEHRILRFKPQLRLEWRGQDGQNETEQPDHSASLGDSITSSTRIKLSVHTAGVSCGLGENCYFFISFPIAGPERKTLSQQRRAGGDGTSMLFLVPELVVNIAHFELMN